MTLKSKAPWADVPEAYTTGWNDKMQSRSRKSRLLIYDRAQIIEFNRKDISGVVAIKDHDYTKAGKWSCNSYELVIAAGWKVANITQSWGLGYYVDDVSSMKRIKQQLNLDESISNTAVETYLQNHLPFAWQRRCEFVEQLQQIEAAEEALGVEFIEYTYTRRRITRRAGDNCLLINGEVWNYQNTDTVKIKTHEPHSGMGGGSDHYVLLIRSDVEVREVQEYDAYGEESLEGLGYIKNENGNWVRPDEPTNDADPNDPDSPWAELQNLNL